MSGSLVDSTIYSYGSGPDVHSSYQSQDYSHIDNMANIQVEVYPTPTSTHNTPNSALPIVVYRKALPSNSTDPYIPEEHRSENALDYFKRNKWTLKGTWSSIEKPHYHSNTHECYGVITGSSTLILGLPVDLDNVAPGDYLIDHPETPHVEISLEVGDVIILPAGVSHASKYFNKDYRYISAYPVKAPHWKSIYQVNTNSESYSPEADLAEAGTVALPEEDPIFGGKGRLLEVWV